MGFLSIYSFIEIRNQKKNVMCVKRGFVNSIEEGLEIGVVLFVLFLLSFGER